MQQRSAPVRKVYCFGDFRFTPTRQLLLHRDVPVRVGSRALDLLHALVENAGELVTKDALMRFAWPTTFVDESNLKVNMVYLRRALSHAPTDLPFIATITGRGYRFVAPLHTLEVVDGPVIPDPVRAPSGNLPGPIALIGRDKVLADLASALSANRLLTITGPAGVGKTCVAVAAVRELGQQFRDGVYFVDLATVADPHLVAPAIAFAVGLDNHLAISPAALVDLLRGLELMLVLDNCEHLLSAAASVADHLQGTLAGLSIVATSREPLRCKTETVYRLSPLPCPAALSETDTAAAMGFAAVELLVRRAESRAYRLDPADLPSLAAISRRLDGIPLAIELAAPRLAALGAKELLDLIGRSFDVLGPSENDATPRHRTLVATLDWSYRLLPWDVARLLRHVSVFAGGFTLEDVVGTVEHLGQNAEDIAASLDSLVAKSLLAMSYARGRPRYRLLASTRSFAGAHLRAEGEQQSAMAGYTLYLLQLFERAEAEWSWRTREDWTATYGYWANDLRHAIEWAFGDSGDVMLGVRLTAAATTFWNEFSSVIECQGRVAAALDAANGLPSCDPRLKLKLVTARATNGCLSSCLDDGIEAALDASRQLAEQMGSAEYRLRSAFGLTGVQIFRGRYREALDTLGELRRFIDATGEGSATPDVNRLEFVIRFYLGQVENGYAGLASLAREHAVVAHRCRTSRFHLDRYVAIRSYLALPAWVVGDQAGAMRAADAADEAAATLDHAISCAHALAVAAIPVSMFCGALDLAETRVDRLAKLVERRQMRFWEPVVRFYQGAIEAARGGVCGLGTMRVAIDQLDAAGCRLQFPMRLATLAHYALLRNRPDIARSTIAEALEYAARQGERWCVPELLRILAIVRWHEGDAPGARQAFEEAVRAARKAGASSFELRASVSRARLALETGRDDGALAQLKTIYERLAGGADNADLAEARALLSTRDAVPYERAPVDPMPALLNRA